MGIFSVNSWISELINPDIVQNRVDNNWSIFSDNWHMKSRKRSYYFIALFRFFESYIKMCFHTNMVQKEIATRPAEATKKRRYVSNRFPDFGCRDNTSCFYVKSKNLVNESCNESTFF